MIMRLEPMFISAPIGMIGYRCVTPQPTLNYGDWGRNTSRDYMYSSLARSAGSTAIVVAHRHHRPLAARAAARAAARTHACSPVRAVLHTRPNAPPTPCACTDPRAPPAGTRAGERQTLSSTGYCILSRFQPQAPRCTETLLEMPSLGHALRACAAGAWWRFGPAPVWRCRWQIRRALALGPPDRRGSDGGDFL
eukprot:COSAG02_NODE_3451_length_6715_cov_7.265146_7_plen_194_part_00